MYHTTTHKDGRLFATMPGIAGTFLAVSLARVRFTSERPLALCVPSGIGQLPYQRLVHQITINFCFKNASGKVYIVNFLASHVEN
jgi:hypothetical protein